MTRTRGPRCSWSGHEPLPPASLTLMQGLLRCKHGVRMAVPLAVMLHVLCWCWSVASEGIEGSPFKRTNHIHLITQAKLLYHSYPQASNQLTEHTDKQSNKQEWVSLALFFFRPSWARLP